MLAGYAAARTNAAWLVRRGRGTLALTGTDRAAFLQGLLTNDILALRPGTGCYAALLTPQGRMVTDLRVFELGDRTLLDVPGPLADRLAQRLEGFVITEDVQIANWSAEWCSVGVYGPRAAQQVAALAGPAARAGAPALDATTLAALPEYSLVRLPVRGTEIVAAATREASVPGLELYLPRGFVETVTDTLRAAGLPELGADAFDALRIEAGRPAFGLDLDEDTIPLEAGIEERAISFTKGCYVGQELIARILHRGHGRVARRLVGLIVETRPAERTAVVVPPPGTALYAGTAEVGRITSAAFSPALGTVIALGYVRRDHAAPETPLEAALAAGRLPARVAALPFVRTE